MLRRPRRRTQAERSAETRGRVLDAAVECLAEFGYAGATTTVIAKRAGVSRGAQLHHFPTRAKLIAAAVQHVFADIREAYQKSFAQLSPDADRISAGIDLLWKNYCDPRLDAVLELYVAARTDQELRVGLAEVSQQHSAHILVLAREYFPEVAALRHDFDSLIGVVLNALQGLAVARVFDDPNARDKEARQIEQLKLLARGVLVSSRLKRSPNHPEEAT